MSLLNQREHGRRIVLQVNFVTGVVPTPCIRNAADDYVESAIGGFLACTVAQFDHMVTRQAPVIKIMNDSAEDPSTSRKNLNGRKRPGNVRSANPRDTTRAADKKRAIVCQCRIFPKAQHAAIDNPWMT
jgi:hypothetical protein